MSSQRDGVLSDPALHRTIQAIAARTARICSQTDGVEARADLEQTLWAKAIELFEGYRGERGASFTTYAYPALAFEAFRALASAESPVHLSKHRKKDAWKQRVVTPTMPQSTNARLEFREAVPPADTMDLLPSEARTDEALEHTDLSTRLSTLLEGTEEAETVRAVLTGEESYRQAAERLGKPVGRLRQAVARFKKRAGSDPDLRAYWGAESA